MSDCKYHIELDGSGDTSHALMLELVGATKRVLDVGCATGYFAQALTAAGNTVSGVEYDAEAAEAARPHLKDLVVGDLEALDLVKEFGEHAFDVVVFGDVLEHLRDPVPVLRQAHKLLAPNGSVIISVPNVAHGDVRLALLAGQFPYGKLGLLDETHTRFFTRDNLDTFLRASGFAAVDVRRTIAPLFGTELPVRPEDYDPAVVAQVQADPESMTYQFVLRALPENALTVEPGLTRRLDQQRARLTELESSIDTLREAGRAAAAERDALAVRVAGQDKELAGLQARCAELAAEQEAIHRTKLWRASRAPRRIYGKLRHRG
jgi:2-polyprenyl-3-methyl-5-hydroxy-6-metoxy-1,4-benzoquinol methylase